MTTVTVRQLRSEYAALLREVALGRHIAITQRGRTVAVLTPPPARTALDWAESAAFGLEDIRPMSVAVRKALLADNKGRY